MWSFQSQGIPAKNKTIALSFSLGITFYSTENSTTSCTIIAVKLFD